MDSGWAVVIGAVVAFVGTILGPFLLDARKRRAEAYLARRAELSELIPRMFRLYEQPLVLATIPEETSTLARLNLLLDKDDWPIVSILTLIGTPPFRTPSHQGAALDMVSAWFRGSISSAEASLRFQRRFNLTISGAPFDVTEEPPSSAKEGSPGGGK
jgi:hypothetical protein